MNDITKQIEAFESLRANREAARAEYIESLRAYANGLEGPEIIELLGDVPESEWKMGPIFPINQQGLVDRKLSTVSRKEWANSQDIRASKSMFTSHYDPIIINLFSQPTALSPREKPYNVGISFDDGEEIYIRSLVVEGIEDFFH